MAQGFVGNNPVTPNFVTDSGTATAVSNSVSILGTGGTSTSATGSTITVTSTDVGAWTLIDTQTASASATLDFTTGITSAYNTYVFVLDSVRSATSGSTGFLMQVSTDTGSSYLSSGYISGVSWIAYNSSTVNNINVTGDVRLTPGEVDTNYGICGNIYMYNIATAKEPMMMIDLISRSGSADTVRVMGTANNATTSSVDAFQFSFSSGNIADGTIRLFGITG